MDESSNNYSQQTLRGLIATYCNVALMLLSSRSLFKGTRTIVASLPFSGNDATIVRAPQCSKQLDSTIENTVYLILSRSYN